MNSEVFWTVDRKNRCIYGENGINVHLTKSEFELFYYLISSEGEVRSNDSIIDVVWSESEGSRRPDSSNLIQLISKTRRQLKLLGNIIEIKSRRGVGYYISLTDGYTFDDNKIAYTADTIYDRDPDSEKKYRLFQTKFLNEVFSINENRDFRIRDLGFIFLLSMFIIGIILNRNISKYPQLPLVVDSNSLSIETCNIDAEIIFTNVDISCDDVYDFHFEKNNLYIINKIKDDFYVTTL